MRKANKEHSEGGVTYPAQTLVLNRVAVGAQYGSCAGIMATASLSLLSKSFSGSLPRSWRRIMVPSTLIGIAATSSMLYYEHSNGTLKESIIDERAYNIATDEERIKIDKYSLYGLVSGAIASVIVGQSLFSLSFTGLALGYTFYHGQKEFVNNKNSKTMEMYAPKWIAKE